MKIILPWLSFLTVSLPLAGCASAPTVNLVPGAESVKVAKSDPANNYQHIGSVTGVGGEGCGRFGSIGRFEDAIIDIKNRAHSAGGEYVQIFTINEPNYDGTCSGNKYTISGTVYKKIRELP